MLLKFVEKSRLSQLRLQIIQVFSPTVPLQWLHMSHIGIRANVGSPVVLGILFWRVIIVETAHLWCKAAVRNNEKEKTQQKQT